MSLKLEVFKILKVENHNNWIWEGRHLCIFIEVWQNVRLLTGWGVEGGAGARHPYLPFQPAGNNHRPLRNSLPSCLSPLEQSINKFT